MHDPGHGSASHADVAHGHDAHGHSDHGGIAKYMYVFLALCGLTTLSFFTYSDFWPKSLDDDHVKWLFMMAVSCTKAMLVVLFFMHVKYEANWKYVLTIPASIMAVFLVMALVPDIGLRVKTYADERLRRTAGPEDVERLREASHQAGAAHSESHEEHEEVEPAGTAEGPEHDAPAHEEAPADEADASGSREEPEPAEEPEAAAPSATEGGADEETSTEQPSVDAAGPGAE